jgi:DNA processing protein
MEEGREVRAVPGEITSALSVGANALLRVGATPALSSADVLAAIGLEPAGAADEPVTPPAGSQAVLAAVRDGPASADELARATGTPAAALAAILCELELAGLVAAEEGIYRAV